jgi:pimeloyl-ACP methyl ester carboxylesterase
VPKFKTTDGVELFYESVGEGMPLILVHPPLMGHVVFKHQRELAKDYRLIFLDLRGHGRSDRHVQDVTMVRLREDLHDLLDHLGVQKAAFLGYSAGGAICQAFASFYPERVSALILSGGFMKVESFLLKLEFLTGINLLKWRKRDFLSRAIARSHGTSETDHHELYDYAKKSDPEVVEKMYRECQYYNGLSSSWHLKDVPILLLYGEKSYLRKHLKTFLRELPNVRYAFIEKANHQLPTNFAGPFNQLVDRFLKSQNGPVLQ